MSLSKVKKALCNFAASEASAAIVLKGDWGVGKTHFWNEIVKSNSSSFSKKQYSYVSLFGLNSLSDLKRSIFENTVECSKAGECVTKESVIENLKRLDFSDGKSWFRRNSKFGKEVKIPFVGSFAGVIESIQYAMVGELIICIDDFERRGNGLSSRDVLGLISSLVESKKCSVVLILNDGSLDEEDEFFSFSEKVFDYEVTFAPTVQESVGIVFDSTVVGRKFVAENSINLGIGNIRLLRKIDFFSTILDGVLESAHPEVVKQAHSTLPLAVFAVYGGGNCKVDIDFVLGYQGSLASYISDETNISVGEAERKRAEREKSAYLDQYGFGRCDEFDTAIIDLVKRGYADEEILKSLVDELEKKIKHDAGTALLKSAWELFHSSFSENDEEVLAAFELAISEALQCFDLNDLDSVVSVYYLLGRKQTIEPVIDKYFVEVFPALGIKDKFDIFQRPTNGEVSSKLDCYFESLVVKGDFHDLLRAVVEGSGFPDGDLRRSIAQAADDDFYAFFGNFQSKDFSRYARALLKCGEVQSYDPDATDDYKAIFMKTYSALLKLSKLTPLNGVRMNKFRNYDEIYNAYVCESKKGA